MKKVNIHWDKGCGDSYEVVGVKVAQQAKDLAYEYWREEVEVNSSYQIALLQGRIGALEAKQVVITLSEIKK